MGKSGFLSKIAERVDARHAHSAQGFDALLHVAFRVIIRNERHAREHAVGASGAQEGGFAVLFRGIFPDAQLFVALLIWRFSTYYLSILAGAALTVAENLGALGKKHTKAKREGVSNEQGH